MTSGRVAFWFQGGPEKSIESGLNILVGSKDLVHVGFRPAKKEIVLNTRVDGKWGKERSIVRTLTPGLFELMFIDGRDASLRLGDLELLSIPVGHQQRSFLESLSEIAIYGDVHIITVEGEFTRKTVTIAQALHPDGSEFLSVLRSQLQNEHLPALWDEETRNESDPFPALHVKIGALMESLKRFDLQHYVDMNPDLRGRFGNRWEALEHFLNEGIADIRQFDESEIFDAEFYRARYEDVGDFTNSKAYAHWLTIGRAESRASSEEKLMQRLGLSLSAIPSSFSADRYATEMGVPVEPFRTRWDAFEHWVGQIVATHALLTPMDDAADCAWIYNDIANSFAKRGENVPAARLYRRALLLDPNRVQIWQHLGDALLRSGHFAGAQAAYTQAVSKTRSYYYSHRNLIEAERGLGRIRVALDVARDLKVARPEHIDAIECAEGLERQLFEIDRRRATSMVLAGRRADAVAVIRSTFTDNDLRDMECAALPVCVGHRPRVLIFGTPYLRQCVFYRIEQKLEQIKLAGLEVDFIPQNEPGRLISEVGAYDVVIFYRVPAFPEIEKAIIHCRRIGVVTFYEIDDLIFDPLYFPDTIENYSGQLTMKEYANLVVDAPLFERAMSLCEYGIASTPSLQRRMEKVVARKICFLHRNSMDSRHERFAAQHALVGSRPPSDEVTLFYASGTKAHNEDFELLAAPAIAELFRNRSGLRLVVMGHLPIPDMLLPYEDRIVQLPPVWDTNVFWSALAQADINLSVLKPSVLSDGKSEIKWLEAAMLRIPSVVSPTTTHVELLTDGVDAMLAGSVDAWEQKLSMLVASPELRAAIGARAFELASSQYAPSAGAKNIDAIIDSALEERRNRFERQAPKPLILIVNVFFWPQMTGGATRVVRDNLDYFSACASDEFDFQVFCAAEGARKPYETRTHFYGDTRVTSVTHPMRAGMDWEPVDEEMGRIFRRHLERWRPSLIHFHCVQRLSACVVEAALELGIPYIVTVHDAWWISDHQFLVDDKGKVVTPESASPIASIRESGDRATAGIKRALRLRAALAASERVVAVSAAFEKIYRSFGVGGNICTIANGVSKLPKANRRRSSDGRIRLGYVGGISDHKGFGLIRRALSSTSFTRLTLTVVDHSLNDGEDGPTRIWGTTPVHTIGKLPQDRVVELYENLDVLLAPSIWPESFGLVVREALMCGVWAVASDRGAIGDDVTPGDNGFIIDVSDTHELIETLREIDSNPSRFSEPPARRPDFRGSSEQAKELILLYRRILSERERVSSAPFLEHDSS
jgi:glycosyltransferase involved in cell wall biosynthesis